MKKGNGKSDVIAVKDVMDGVGYGNGTTTGFTTDGKVFLVIDTTAEDGRPMQTMVDFSPTRAEELATSIAEASRSARKYKKVA